MQRTSNLSAFDFLLSLGGASERLFTRERDDRFQPGIDALGALEISLRQFDRRQLLRRNLFRQLCDGLVAKIFRHGITS